MCPSFPRLDSWEQAYFSTNCFLQRGKIAFIVAVCLNVASSGPVKRVAAFAVDRKRRVNVTANVTANATTTNILKWRLTSY